MLPGCPVGKHPLGSTAWGLSARAAAGGTAGAPQQGERGRPAAGTSCAVGQVRPSSGNTEK